MKRLVIVLSLAIATIGFTTESFAKNSTEVYCGGGEGEGKCCKSGKKGKKGSCDKKTEKKSENAS